MLAAALSYTIRSDARTRLKTPLRFKQNASAFQLKRKYV